MRQAIDHLRALVGEVLRREAMARQVSPWRRQRWIRAALLSVAQSNRTTGKNSNTTAQARAHVVIVYF